MEQKKVEKYLKNKKILVTGGTGTFGEYLVRKLLEFKPKRIIIFSRDELKQHQLRHALYKYRNTLKFVIGDVRNIDSLLIATRGVDIVYHAAAMKHVPICEENPIEAVYTNVHGAYNLKEAAIRNKIPHVIAISTDKAVRSVNIMGMTKAIQERILLLEHNELSKTKFVCVRFGNVVGSRGSVVPLFTEKIKKGEPLPLTEKTMTRFFITLESAMELIFTATLEGEGREIFVKKMPVVNIHDLAQVMIEELAKNKNYPVDITGPRQGEQLYETLVSEEEMRRTKETEDYFVVYPYSEEKRFRINASIVEYRTDLIKERMKKNDIKFLLKRSGWL